MLRRPRLRQPNAATTLKLANRSCKPKSPNRRLPTQPRLTLPALAKGIPMLVALGLSLMSWRKQSTEIPPLARLPYAATGEPLNLRALSLQHVVTATENEDGKPALVIAGTIVNGSLEIAKIPRLHFSLRDWADVEVYSWTTILAQTALAPGETLTFRSRLEMPPSQTHHVVARLLQPDGLIIDRRPAVPSSFTAGKVAARHSPPHHARTTRQLFAEQVYIHRHL